MPRVVFKVLVESQHGDGTASSESEASLSAARRRLNGRKQCTIMGGNVLDYYSNPRVKHPQLGLPLGVEGKYDVARLITQNRRQFARTGDESGKCNRRPWTDSPLYPYPLEPYSRTLKPWIKMFSKFTRLDFSFSVSISFFFILS